MLFKLLILSFALSQVAGLGLSLPTSPGDVQPFVINHPSPCNNFSRTYETNPRGCSWFWECKDENGALLNTPLEGICANNLHFNAVRQSCSYDVDVVPRCSFDEENAVSTECVAWQPMKLIPHPFDCSKYFMCWDDLTVEQECEEGQHFSFYDNACIHPFYADCRAADNYCRGAVESKELVKKNPFSCTKYHVCSHCNDRYSLTELECSDGTHEFNAELNHCDVAANVTCTPKTLDNKPGNFPTELTMECPAGVVSYEPHTQLCDFYFLCAYGRSFLQQCAVNNNFDPTRRTCVANVPNFICPLP